MDRSINNFNNFTVNCAIYNNNKNGERRLASSAEKRSVSSAGGVRAREREANHGQWDGERVQEPARLPGKHSVNQPLQATKHRRKIQTINTKHDTTASESAVVARGTPCDDPPSSKNK